MKVDRIEQISRIINSMKIKSQLKDKKIAERFKLSCSELNCLKQYYNEDNLSVKELAERLNITSGGVTRIVAQLEERGILRRDIDPEDRRGINVTLTETGKNTVSELYRRSIKYYKKMFEGLNDDQKSCIYEGLKLLNDSWEKAIEMNRDKDNVHLLGSDNC